MSVLYYGENTMAGCRTLDFEQSTVRDDSQTDVIGTKVRLRVQGYMHLKNISIHGFDNAVGKQSLSIAYNLIKNQMMRQRQFLQYSIEGGAMVSARPYSGQGSPANASDDIGNGPTPISFSVTKVIGSSVLECEFEIEALLSGTDSSLTVLSNRFSVSDALDENFYCTRTWRGKLRIVSPALNAHAFRGLVIPPLSKGFRRKRVEVTSTTNGLELDYAISDEQTTDAPPSPATTWGGEHTIRVSQMGGDMSGIGTTYLLNITLSGPPDVKKYDLLCLAAAIARNRIGYQSVDQSSVVLQDYSLTDVIGSNTVRLSLNVFSPGAVTDAGGIDATKIGTPLSGQGFDSYEQHTCRAPADFGYVTTAGLFISLLQSPATMESTGSGAFAISASTTDEIPTLNTASQNGGTKVAAFTAQSLPPFQTIQSPYDSSHGGPSSGSGRPYTYYQLEIRTESDRCKAVLPLANVDLDTSKPTVAIIPLAAGVSKRIVTVDAERVGSAPRMPEATEQYSDTNGIVYHLLHATMMSPQAPEVSYDGKKKVMRLKCQYTYAMSRPLKASEKLDLGTLPWDTTTLEENRVTIDATFSGGLFH